MHPNCPTCQITQEVAAGAAYPLHHHILIMMKYHQTFLTLDNVQESKKNLSSDNVHLFINISSSDIVQVSINNASSDNVQAYINILVLIMYKCQLEGCTGYPSRLICGLQGSAGELEGGADLFGRSRNTYTFFSSGFGKSPINVFLNNGNFL